MRPALDPDATGTVPVGTGGTGLHLVGTEPARVQAAAPYLLAACRLVLPHLQAGVRAGSCDWCDARRPVTRDAFGELEDESYDVRDELDLHTDDCEYAQTVAALERAGDSITDRRVDAFVPSRDAFRIGD